MVLLCDCGRFLSNYDFGLKGAGEFRTIASSLSCLLFVALVILLLLILLFVLYVLQTIITSSLSYLARVRYVAKTSRRSLYLDRLIVFVRRRHRCCQCQDQARAKLKKCKILHGFSASPSVPMPIKMIDTAWGFCSGSRSLLHNGNIKYVRLCRNMFSQCCECPVQLAQIGIS
jgi:hypothetical protein